MNTNNLPISQRFRIENLIRTVEAAKLDKDPVMRNLIFACAADNDFSLVEDIMPIMNLKAVYERLNGIPFTSPSQEISSHDVFNDRAIIIGRVKGEERLFTYPIDWLNQHSVITGGSGTGKTNLLYGIVLQCMQKGIPVIIFDKDKTDYRHLRRINPNLLVFNANKVPVFNPLAPPPGVDSIHWLNAFIQIFAKSHDLLGASEAVLIKACVNLYKKFGVLEGNDEYPTLIDLYEKIDSYSLGGNKNSGGYQEPAKNRLEAYVKLNPELYEYSKCIPLDYLLQHSFVYEVKGFTDRMARFMMTILLYAIFLYRIANCERNNALKTLILADECSWLAPYGFNKKIGQTPLASILSMGREAGLGLVLASQTAKLEDSVYVNSMLRICLRLQNGEDIEKTGKTLALTEEQTDYIAKLDRGEAIVRIPREDPFLMETLKVNIE